MNRFWTLILLIAIPATGFAMAWQQEEGRKTANSHDPDLIARRDFMRSKLMYSQLMLEGLTTDDFEMVNDAIANMRAVTEGEMWVAFNDDQDYRDLTQDFKQAIDRLEAAAGTANIDAAMMRFYQLNTTCIDCHKHIRARGYKL